MAQEVGGIYSRLSVDATSFDAGLNKAGTRLEQETRRFGNQFGKISGGVTAVGTKIGAFTGTMLASAAGLLSFHAMTAKAKQGLDEFGAIADRAASTGFDAEFLQGIEHQAGLAGLQVDTLNSALLTFSKNAGLAASGKGRMVTALKELDPVLLESIRKATTQEQRLKLVIDALAKETDAARKAAIATSAFGDSGAKIAAAFAGGSAEIDAQMVKAKELGLVVDRDLIARADELGDEYETVTKIVDLQLKQALVSLGPIMIWLAQLGGGIADQLGHAADGLKEISQQSTSTLEGRLKGIDLQAADVNPAMAAGLTPEQAAELKAPILDELRKRAMDNLRTQLTARPPTTPDIPTLDEINDRNEGARAAIRQAEAVKALVSDLEFEQSLIGKNATETRIATELRKAGAAATEEQRTAIISTVMAIEQQNAALEATKAQFESIRESAHSFLSTFVSGMRSGKSVVESLGDALGNLGDRLLDMAMDQPIAGPLHNFHS